MDHSVMKGSCSQVKMASPEVPCSSSRSNLSRYSLGGQYMEGERNVLAEAEDVDVQMCFCCCEGLSDDNECMWLSSGGTSTSCLTSEDLQSLDIWEINFCDPLLYDQSIMGNRSTIFNGSTNDLSEATPVLVRVQHVVDEDLNDDGNKVKDSSQGSLECVESAHGRSCCDDLSSNYNGPWPSLGMHAKPSPSEDDGFDRTDIWVSLLDLDNEEFDCDGDGYDGLDPDFPSPSYRTVRNLRIKTSRLTFCPSSKQLLGAQASLGSPSSIFDLSSKHASVAGSPPKHSDFVDEPLFWPFDWKSYWRSEFEGNYLGISPRAGILRIKRPRGVRGPRAPKRARVETHNMNDPSPHREKIQQGCRGRILISSRSARPAPIHRKTKDQSYGDKAPSRLRISTASSSDKSESKTTKKGGKGQEQLNSGKKKRARDEKSSLVQYLLDFEAGEFQIYLGGEIPVEALVGLDEFDGHEGFGKMMRAS